MKTDEERFQRVIANTLDRSQQLKYGDVFFVLDYIINDDSFPSSARQDAAATRQVLIDRLRKRMEASQ